MYYIYKLCKDRSFDGDLLPLDVDNINKLLFRLSKRIQGAPYALTEIESIAWDRRATVFIAREADSKIVVGLAVLSTKPTFTDGRGWAGPAYLDDVVIDKGHEGHGVARQLLDCVINDAQVRKFSRIDLTCRVAREKANKLYQEIGFILVGTYVDPDEDRSKDRNYYTLKL